MPKLRKEKVDEIKKLLEEGYTITEVMEKTHVSRNPVTNIAKELKAERETVPQKQTSTTLNNESMKKIGFMQGIYGADSLDDVIDKIYEDVKLLTQLKFRFDNDVNKTLSDVFGKEIEKKDVKIAAFENIMKPNISFFHQMLCFNLWGIDPAVKAFYDLFGDPVEYPTLLKFMEKAVIGSFTEHGWKVDYYWNKLLECNMPILTDPKGRVFQFPIESLE